MATIPKVILVEPDARRAAQLRFAFARAGLLVRDVASDAVSAALHEGSDSADVVVVGDAARDHMQGWRVARRMPPMLLLAEPEVAASSEQPGDGQEAARAAGIADGADEVVVTPGYLRDVVLAIRLMASNADGHGQFVGGLGEFASTLALLRAVAALGRSGVLTLGRGFRRGEVRYCMGEVTAVQVGGHHGQAALHQLLLWSDARFDFRREDVVRRQQIPLPPDELFADAERFLAGVRSAAGGLSPVSVLELDDTVAQANAGSIPAPVHGVLRLFDGKRAFGDILEDSPYRVFETLRVVLRARELGLLRASAQARRRPGWTPQSGLERWLVGEPEMGPSGVSAAGAIPVAVASSPSAATAPTGRGKKNRRRTPHPRDAELAAAVSNLATASPIDWGVLAPRSVGAEMIGLSGVVPAAGMQGEIVVARLATPPAVEAPATRKSEREGLEALTDAAARDRVFASMGGPRSKSPSTPPATVALPAAPEVLAAAAPPVSTQPPASASGEIGERPRAATVRSSREQPIAAAGEITPRPRAASSPPVAAVDGPAILVADLAADLATAHATAGLAAATALAPHAVVAPATVIADVAAVTVAEVRADAAHAHPVFSDDEEQFFKAGVSKPVAPAATKVEAFRDLDADYEPVGFWDRLRGKKPTNHGDR